MRYPLYYNIASLTTDSHNFSPVPASLLSIEIWCVVEISVSLWLGQVWSSENLLRATQKIVVRDIGVSLMLCYPSVNVCHVCINIIGEDSQL